MPCRIIYIAFIFFLVTISDVIVFGQRPSNDRCIDSIILLEGEMENGDNSFANYDYNNQGVCGSRSDRRAVWYEINGIGKEVTVNVCTNNDKITDFGIFNTCNTQNCLGAPPQQLLATDCNGEESNTYSFLAENGESYYVHVRSDVVFEGVGSNFTIWYTEPTDEPTSTTVPTDEPTSTPVVSDDEPESGESPSSSSSLFYSTIFSTVVVCVVIGLSSLTTLL